MSYTTEIVAHLSENNYSVSTIFGDTLPVKDFPRAVVDKIKYIPDANQKLILSNIRELMAAVKSSTLDCLLAEASSRGFLKFKPYLTDFHGTPMLVLRYNRFVHLFRGRNFQVSYTPNGVGEYQSANVRLDVLLGNYPDARESKLFKLLFYMNCINACTGIDSFSSVLRDDPAVIDEFVKKSASKFFKSYDVTYDDLKALFVDASLCNADEPEPLNIYHVYKSATMDTCRVSIYSTTHISVEYLRDNAYHKYYVTMPFIEENLFSDKDDYKYALYDINHDMNILYQLVTFGLNSIGMVINAMVVYPCVKSDDAIKALNRLDVKDLEKITDITI